MREVIIGLIQLENELGDKEHNLEKAVSLIGEAAKKGAGIICLPELFVTGYHLEALKDDMTWRKDRMGRFLQGCAAWRASWESI